MLRASNGKRKQRSLTTTPARGLVARGVSQAAEDLERSAGAVYHHRVWHDARNDSDQRPGICLPAASQFACQRALGLSSTQPRFAGSVVDRLPRPARIRLGFWRRGLFLTQPPRGDGLSRRACQQQPRLPMSNRCGDRGAARIRDPCLYRLIARSPGTIRVHAHGVLAGPTVSAFIRARLSYAW